MTVDEILATGQYTDRRGREWVKHTYLHGSVEWLHFVTGGTYASGPAQMRLLIERDQHRDECAGLGFCLAHPVPHVISLGPHRFEVFGPRSSSTMRADRLASTFPAAMDAARALAVGE